MRNTLNLLTVLLAIVAFSTCANADIISVQPNPADMYDLDHQYFYIWDVELSIPDNQILTSASIFFDNINDWQIEPSDKLYISLLNESEMNSAVLTKHMTKAYGSDIYRGVDNETVGDALAGYGTEIAVYEDDNEYRKYGRWTNPAEDFTYNFSETVVDLLNSYISGNGTFGIGFDPDCHYYNDGVKFCYMTEAIPEPATMATLGIGALFMFGNFRKKPATV